MLIGKHSSTVSRVVHGRRPITEIYLRIPKESELSIRLLSRQKRDFRQKGAFETGKDVNGHGVLGAADFFLGLQRPG
jgi:hypothetical protein